jgi:hypothetical protein
MIYTLYAMGGSTAAHFMQFNTVSVGDKATVKPEPLTPLGANPKVAYSPLPTDILP